MQGWIKLHRSLKDWGWRSDPITLAVFINLLLEANFKESTWKGRKVLPGDLIFGRKAFSKRTGISEQSIRTAINHLKSTNEITIKSTNRYSVISINNWDRYQLDNQLPNQQLTSNQPATNHTIRKKEGKNVKNRYTSINSLGEKEFEELAQTFKVPVSFVRSKYDDLKTYCSAKGKKYKNYFSALRNWVKRDAIKIKKGHNDRSKISRVSL